jgi:hypothetical protein
MRTRAHRFPISLLAALALLLGLAAPSLAGGPQEQSEEPIFLIFADPDLGIVAFWNVTRDGYCAWEESDFDGEPPALDLVTSYSRQTPTGAVIYRWSQTAHLELWTLDEGADLSGPCQDTDDSTEPWAVGTATMTNADNDLFHDESVGAGLKRTNAFGDHGRGTVWDADGGAWHFGWIFRGQLDNELNFRVVADRVFLHPIR